MPSDFAVDVLKSIKQKPELGGCSAFHGHQTFSNDFLAEMFLLGPFKTQIHIS